ncbi:MAG TPA: tRNA (adenosine(37)-N6)-threonylcarbamoyltransferase complex dimerization subunit type 1 TsaB [Bryobacteraceae bacterium]|nr:tRNA (adenosine(37)-N6)-threonylcarbamoyltransferase complex dimerization subunit type 1 TsaB [Bryobacteraceae bacterium]
MKILSIDTTSELGSIALTEGERVIEEVALHSPEGFAHVLFGEVENLLARHGMTLADVEGYASASGPGTFTGVRVGLTAAKGLADAASRKVVAVSNLKALASLGTGALRAPFLDARRGEIYGAVYDAELNLIRAEVVTKYDTWVASLPEGVEMISQPRPLAGAIGRIAAREFAAGRGLDPAAIDANYVRRSDAELLWKDVP